MMRSDRLMLLALPIGVVSISTAAVFIKLCDDAAPVVIAAARLGLATLLLAPAVILTRGRRALVLDRRRLGQVALAGVLMAAHFLFWISSLKYTSVLSSVVIVTMNPLFVGMASYLVFRESLRGGLIAGIVVSAAGGTIIMAADRGAMAGSLRGDLLSLAAAGAMSGYLLVGRAIRQTTDVWSYLVPVNSIASAVLCLAAAGLGHGFSGYRPATYGYFVLLALVPQLLGHSCLNWALGHVSATVIAVCILGEPVGASLIAYVFLKEPVSLPQALGGGLILAGIFIAVRAQPIRPATPDPSAM